MRSEPVKVRFWKYVRKTTGCWEWTGARYRKGYGKLWRNLKAHRVSWEIYFGAIPSGLFVLHECDNPPCVRPDHLFLGTNRDNIVDAVKKGRIDLSKLHATAGHTKNRRRGRDNHNYGATYMRGEGNASVKLTEDQVLELRALEGTMSQEELAERFNIGQAQVSRILRRVSWGHV